jgi:endonuclease/exonuclease/phosphatase family metal-dependent hydrolase
MTRFGFALCATLFIVSGEGDAADLKLASWNLGWHLSQAEAKSWIVACDAHYELDQNKVWKKSFSKQASSGWKMDWRPKDADIKLPWDIEVIPPCNVYQDDNRKVIPVTLSAIRQRTQGLSKVIQNIAPDVIAFQEVSGEASIKEVLGKSANQYQTCSYTGYSVQRLAFAWKKSLGNSKSLCEKYDALSLPENGKERRPRPGLRLALNINGKKTAFLNVHLKSSCVSPLEKGDQRRGQLESDQRDCVVLQQQLQPLENWIEQASLNFDRYVVLGDFNRDLWHETESVKTIGARVDASASAGPLGPKVRVRLLLAEVNDGMPEQSAMTLVSASCNKDDASRALCAKAKKVRLSSDELNSLSAAMGCRYSVALDHMLVSDNWNAEDATQKAEKIAIAPGSSSSVKNDKGLETVTLALSDHCPMQITLPH